MKLSSKGGSTTLHHSGWGSSLGAIALELWSIAFSDRAIKRYQTADTSEFSTEAFFSAFGSFVGVFLGSFAIGGLAGVLTALMFKFTKIGQFPVLETSVFFLMSWGCFLLAESVGLTGIVAVLFCGILQVNALRPAARNSVMRCSFGVGGRRFPTCVLMKENFAFRNCASCGVFMLDFPLRLNM